MENAVKEKETKTTKQKVFFGLEIFGNVVFYSIIIFLLLFAIFNINGGNGKNNFPNLFGRGALSVQSDSMDHTFEDKDYEELEEWDDYKLSNGFKKGDLLTDKVFKSKTTKSLEIGDVITFYDADLEDLNTHRIVLIVDDYNVVTQGDRVAMEEGYSVGAGKVMQQAYIVPGSERAINSGLTAEQISAHNFALESNKMIENVSVGNIKGVAISVTKGAGKTLDNVQDNYLFYFVLPVALLLIVEVFLVIRNIMILRGEKNVAALDSRKEEIIAEEKERMRLELLAEMYGGIENIPEEMKNPKKPEAPKEENNETTEEVENKELGNNETNEVVEETNNEVVKDDTVDVEEVENSSEQSPEAAEEAVEDKPEVESDVEPQDDKKEEE